MRLHPGVSPRSDRLLEDIALCCSNGWTREKRKSRVSSRPQSLSELLPLLGTEESAKRPGVPNPQPGTQPLVH